MRIDQFVPDPEVLLAMPPEELAGYLLRALASSGRKEHQADIATPNSVSAFPPDTREVCQRAVMEAWQHLVSQGLVAPDPGNSAPVYFVTRLGSKVATLPLYADFQKARLFPRASLHPAIATSTFSLFIRGSYETAVFEAFKSVEVAVREAGSYGASDLGVDLMRRAFNPSNGPLTDQNEPPGERQALSDLFAGALGRFKNPGSHRHVTISEPAEAVEMLQFASHLLRIVDQRRP